MTERKGPIHYVIVKRPAGHRASIGPACNEAEEYPHGTNHSADRYADIDCPECLVHLEEELKDTLRREKDKHELLLSNKRRAIACLENELSELALRRETASEKHG